MRDLDFSPYTVVRAPLTAHGWPSAKPGARYHNDARTWPDANGPGVTTASHAMALATDESGAPVILVEHGGGREIVPLGYRGWGVPLAVLEGFAAMDDRQLYATLYTVHKLTREAADKAREETALRYGHAFLEGRMKKRRRRGMVRLEIATGYQPTVNGEHFSPRSYLTPEEATAAGEAEAKRRGLSDAAIAWVGRS